MPPTRRLRTLDLFTGIGGMTHALRGLAVPVAYCDSSEEARAVLAGNRELPRAPVCDDVHEMGRRWIETHAGGQRVDMVVAGVPCTGFSVAGKKQGMRNAASALFDEVLRILDETRAPMLFMENVPHILRLGRHGIDHVVGQLASRGFEVRWCTLGAGHVGCPQRRTRWYCLATRGRRPARLRAGAGYRPARWTPSNEPPRASCEQDAGQSRARYRLLGNSVVPDAVRYAFCFLCNGMSPPGSPAEFFTTRRCLQPVATPRKATARGWPSCGSCASGSVRESESPPKLPGTRAFRLVFSPAKFRSPVPPNASLTTEILKRPIARAAWATPVHGALAASNYLTARNNRILHTQVRFEARTPAAVRGCYIAPEFVEWLMGFPRGWTRCAQAAARM